MVDAVPERQVTPWCPLQVESVGLGEMTRIMVGGGEADDDLGARGIEGRRSRLPRRRSGTSSGARGRRTGKVSSTAAGIGSRLPRSVSSCSGWARRATMALPMNVVVVSWPATMSWKMVESISRLSRSLVPVPSRDQSAHEVVAGCIAVLDLDQLGAAAPRRRRTLLWPGVARTASA